MNQTFTFELKELKEAGTFTGLASTYGGVDLVGDTIAPGAFTRTLQGKSERPLLFSHRDPIGVVSLKDSPHGLIAEGRLSLGVQLARDAFTLLKDGALRSLSIGFSIVREDMKNGIRKLLEVKLHEVSLVAVGANPEAGIHSFKSYSQDEVMRALTSFDKNLERVIQGRW